MSSSEAHEQLNTHQLGQGILRITWHTHGDKPKDKVSIVTGNTEILDLLKADLNICAYNQPHKHRFVYSIFIVHFNVVLFG